jgi:ribosomal protein S18 acetylase RimI-like enzyme
MPPEIGDAFSNFAVLGFGDELPYRMVLARMAGRPVAVALGFLAGGGALILNVATLPDSRRKGLGRAVTLAAMRACATTGATIAVLQSSEMGYEVYRRLGFEEFARYRSFARIEA